VAGVTASNGVSHVSDSVSDSALYQPAAMVEGVYLGGNHGGTHEGDSTDTAAAEPVSTATVPSPAGMSVTITRAAELLGVHPNTLRKRIKKGTLAAHLVEGPTGQEYRIPISALGPPAGEPTPAASPSQAAPSTVSTSQGYTESHSEPHTVVDTAENDATIGATAMQTLARAREMAAYTEQLLAPYVGRIEAQAEEIGRLRAELGHARERAEREAAEREALACELHAARSASASPTTPEGNRPWWRFWQ
jgi:excisionase family DNA binding protein